MAGSNYTLSEAFAARLRDVQIAEIRAIAHWYMQTGQADVDEANYRAALDDLKPYAPEMDDDQRGVLLGQLISELEYQEAVNRDEVAPDPGQDKQDLEELAEQQVDAAAGKLITPWSVAA